jgi:very-short-patch-repair endonuclease
MKYKEYKMKADSYKIWGNDEVQLLIKLFVTDRKTKNEICQILNRSYHSIKKKLKVLGLLCTPHQITKSKSAAMSGSNNPMFGSPSWSRGMTKENNNSLKNASLKISKTRREMSENGLLPDVSGKNNPMYGKPSWCDGLTKDTCEILRSAGRKNSLAKKEAWVKLSDDVKEARIKQLRVALKTCMDKKPRTSIEIKIEDYLSNVLKLKLNEDFIPQLPKDGFIFDFYFPKLNIVIECQGDYYHANPSKYTINELNSTQVANVNRDKRKESYLKKNDISYIFIWEYDIHNNFAEVKEKILSLLSPL